MEYFLININKKYFKLILLHSDEEDILKNNAENSFSRFYNENSMLIAKQSPNLNKKIISLQEKLNIRFNDIIPFSDNRFLLESVYNKSQYVLNIRNIGYIFSSFDKTNKFTNEQISFQNYTTITSSDCSVLQNYVDSKIELYVKEFYESSSELLMKEKQEPLIYLLNTVKSEEIGRIVLARNTLVLEDISSISKKWAIQELAEKNQFVATWQNIVSYYKKCQKVDEILVQYLNKKQNYSKLPYFYAALSAHKTDKDLYEKLFNDLVLNDNIVDAAYSKIISSLPFKFNVQNLVGISSKKVDFLISKFKILGDASSFKGLKEKFPNKHISLLEKHIVKDIDNLSNFILDANDLALVLKSRKITEINKIKILEKYGTNDKLNGQSKLCNEICAFAISIPFFKTTYPYVFTMLNNADDITIKLLFVNKVFFNYSNLTLDLIKKVLVAIGQPYSKIAKKKSRNILAKVPDNLLLAENLIRNNFISQFKDNPKNNDEIILQTKLNID